jgi:NTE family protein
MGDKGPAIRALSGTSGGAVCAVLAWSELVAAAKEQDPVKQNRRLEAFWSDNTTPLWQVLPWAMAFATMRWAGELGVNLETSAYRNPVDGHRMFLDLINRHVPFDKLTPDKLTSADPCLLISAADVLTGEFRVFRSHRVNNVPADVIDGRTVLASAALPTVFRAVTIGDGLYWDGGFTQNPPIRELVEAARRPPGTEGTGDAPEEIELWIVGINPQERPDEPTFMDDIRDRRNELIENMSFLQEVYFISKINELVLAGDTMFTPAARKKYGAVKIRAVMMGREMSDRLDYESKMDRNPAFIQELVDHGKQQADEFLERLDLHDCDLTTTLPDRDIWGTWHR